MPQPQAPAPNQPVNVNQEQAQEQTQNASFNNGYQPQLTDNASSNSSSNAENAVSQIGTLSNTQYNWNNDSYYRSSKGTQLPERMSLITNISHNSWGDTIATIGLQYNFGGSVREIVKDELVLQQAQQTAALCTGLIKENIMIDYELLPEFSRCQAFNTKVVAVAPAEPPVSPNKLLAEELRESIKLIKQQQQTIQALQIRLTQMQHAPKVVQPTW